MRHCAATLLIIFFMYVEFSYCSNGNSELLIRRKGIAPLEEIGRKLKSYWTWIKTQAQFRDTFVGRCIGGIKKIRMALNFIIFKLGVIATTLVFLTAMMFKSLAIGVILLVLSSLGLFSKFALLKQNHHSEHPQMIHYHVYSKGGHGDLYHDREYSWRDRMAHNVDHTSVENMEISDLYNRLGITTNKYHSDAFR